MLGQILSALLLYPGLVLALGLSVLYTVLITGRRPLLPPSPVAWLRNADGVLNSAGIVLAGLGVALVPWPYHPLAPGDTAWFWAWGALEGAFLLPLLPALASGHPLLARAAIREAQIGVVGRALLWVALAAALLLRTEWSMEALPAHLLALLAALFAFPAAIGWGPFTSETSITPAGTDLGLDAPGRALAAFARAVRHAALLGVALVALLPLTLTQPWVGLVLIGAAFALVCVLLRQLAATWPRLPLPDALRLCWLRALPLSLAALVYLAVVRQ